MARKKTNGQFHINFLNSAQKLAYSVYQEHDIMAMLGPAGTGKTHLAAAFAIAEVLNKTKRKIVLTRPIVESGESLGYLPGTFEEKINPYILPVFDCIQKLVGAWQDSFDNFVNTYIEVAPIAYMRGRTFDNSVCIFDEAQNATKSQLKLFLTRFGQNSKIVITGDPKQSDIHTSGNVPIVDVIHRIETLAGVGVIRFGEDSIVRHPLVSEILKRLEA